MSSIVPRSRTDRLVAQPGGHTGWPVHAGPTFVTVISGAISWQDGVDCSARTIATGQSFIERANQPYRVSNQTATEATFLAVQMRPEGAAGRIDVPEAPCPG